MSTSWYAVYTRPQWEKKVATGFTRKDFECYCPMNKTVRQWSDRKKVIYVPLFTSYVFFKATEKQLLEIKQTEGVINIVHWLNKPAVIKNEEIEAIRNFLSDFENVHLQEANVSINDTVRVISGPLTDKEGIVMSLQKKSVKLVLPSLGYAMVAEVAINNVEVLPESKTPIPQTRDKIYAIR